MFPAEVPRRDLRRPPRLVEPDQKFGGDIVVVKLNKDGTVKSVEPFMTGFIQDNNYIGRPVDVQSMKDGSLLVSDDYNGAIYRVSYGNQPRPRGADATQRGRGRRGRPRSFFIASSNQRDDTHARHVSRAASSALSTAARAADARTSGCPLASPATARRASRRTPEVPSLGAPAGGLRADPALSCFARSCASRDHERDGQGHHRRRPARVRRGDSRSLPAPPPSPAPATGAHRRARAALIAQNHCNSCHTPNFAGQDQVPRHRRPARGLSVEGAARVQVGRPAAGL